MTDDTMIQQFKTVLSQSPLPFLEVRIAQCLLQWLDSQTCLYQHYRPMIKELNGLDCYDIDATRSLRFNLWMNSDACLWIAPRYVRTSNDLLWQFAIVRLSRYLQTLTWDEVGL